MAAAATELKMTKTNYPRGGCETWDLSKFDDVTLEYEIELCTQNLYGVWLPQYNAGLKGMMNQTSEEFGCTPETFENARRVWLKRLKDAEDEMFERKVLV
jgi:hypothetical protein